MKRKFIPVFSVTFILLILFPAYTITALDVPALQGRINDYAGLLSSSEKAELEQYLASVEKTTGDQIALLTIPSLKGENLESYSIRVVENWKLGQKGKDNGVLLLVAMDEKKIRIEVGYGLEDTLTDAVSGYIIREIIVPQFKKGNFAGGISEGLHAIGGIVTGDKPIEPAVIEKSLKKESGSGASVIFMLFIFFFVFGGFGRYRRYRGRGMSPGAAFLMGSILGSSMNRSSGSGGSDFGGFSGGGGGFGGGGASGGW